MEQDSINSFRQKMVDAGFYHVRTYLPADMDMATFVFCDRCSLKDRKHYQISFALSGLEMMQGINIINSKIDLLCADYNKAMKDLGGFERADLDTQTRPSASRQEWLRREDRLFDERVRSQRPLEYDNRKQESINKI